MSEDRFEQIERYINREMGEAEQLQFEQQMAADAELYVDVKIFAEIRETVMASQEYEPGDAGLKKTLEELNAGFFLTDENADQLVTAPVKKVKRWRTIIAAAGVVGIIVLSALWLMKSDINQHHIAEVKKTDTVEKVNPPEDIQPIENTITLEEMKRRFKELSLTDVLFERYFKRDLIPSEVSEELKPGFAYYAEGNLPGAKSFFKMEKEGGLSRSDEADNTIESFYIEYYYAQCFMDERKIDEAIPHLNEALKQSPHDSLLAKTQWYLALAYMKKSDKKKAVELLKKMNKNTTPERFKTNAENLLKEFEK